MSYIFKGESLDNPKRIQYLAKESFKNHGIAIFPGLFFNDIDFNCYLNDIRWLFDFVFKKNASSSTHHDLGDKLAALNELSPLDGKIITDLGTQPNKFLSFSKVKYSPLISRLVHQILKDNIRGSCELGPVVTPQAGDTLHFFAPGKSFYKYNLPNHQDFPYLMQSTNQVTCYLGMSDYHDGVGGLGFYLGSNSLGLVSHAKNEHGSFEVVDKNRLLADFEYAEYYWSPGDFAVFDSLLVHRSIPNKTVDRGRVVQIFRYSGLSHDDAQSYSFQSTAYPRRSVQFEDIYQHLYSGFSEAPN